jgi:hypothetical protein
MHLTSNDVILINATVIVGLLILLSFQSTSSPLSISVKVTEKTNQLDEQRTQFNIASNQLKEYKKKLGNQLDAEALELVQSTLPNAEYQKILNEQLDHESLDLLKSKISELNVQLMGIEPHIKSLEEDISALKRTRNIVLSSDEIESAVKLISVVMIFPFAISAAYESIHSYKWATKDASRIGLGSMVAGFIAIAVGLTLLFIFLQL